jgi:peptidoglycan hydrolase-like protein with peptidoglycan-binding domain
MNRAILVSVSAAALLLSGCSMFRSEGSTQRSQAPAASQSSQSSQSSAPSYSQSSPSTPRSSSSTAQTGTRSSTSDYDNTASGTSMRGDQLRQAQQKLKDDGDYTGPIDGKMGPKTAQAIKKFQKSNGLPQTGHLDQQTASKLGISMSGSSQPPSSSSSGSSTGSGTTGSGSSGLNNGASGTGTTGTGSTNQ